jgi:hypothetical protein
MTGPCSGPQPQANAERCGGCETMAIRIELCETCFFYWRVPERTVPLSVCVRFPQSVEKAPSHWCGEHKASGERICGARGRQITRDHPAVHYKLEKYGIPNHVMPGIAAHWEICLREKGHEGLHSDGYTEWNEETPLQEK